MNEVLYIGGLIASGLAGAACAAVGIAYAVLRKRLRVKLNGEYGEEK